MLKVYGEILFFPFADIIRWVAPSLPEFPIFYDLVRRHRYENECSKLHILLIR